MNEFQLPSEDQVEAFLRGESDLEFRSLTDINVDGARYVTRKIHGEDVEFLAVKGVATTAAIDDNGVEVTPDALKSLPADFKRRNTLLFNHNADMPIGTIGKAKFVNGANGRKLSRPARVDVNPVLIDTEARLLTGQRVVTAVERGTLSKFSFSWSTRDGIIVFGPTKSVDKEEIEALGLDADGSFAFRIGSDNSPQIRVNSLVGVELSIVSVPADAAAEFGARFQRNLNQAIDRHTNKRNGIFVPESYQEDSDGRILVPISNFRALASDEEPEEREVETEVEEVESELLEAERNVITIVIESDVVVERLLQTIEERVMQRIMAESETTEDEAEERDISDPPEELKGIMSFRETGVIDRIWSAADVEARVADWARGEEEELDLENDEHQARYEQAYVGYRKDGRSSNEYFLLHHDIVDGELVSNLRGVNDAAERFADTDFGEDSEERIEAASRHLAAEYTAHGEEVPEAFREDSPENDEE